MRKQLLLALVALGAVLPCNAVDFGLGASLNGGNTSIYVPVKLSPNLMLEGRLAFAHTYQISSEQTQNPDGTLTNAPVVTSSMTRDLSVGFFWIRPLTGNSNIYLGPRIGGSQGKWSNGGGIYGGTVSTDTNGVFISPVLGFEYFPIKSVSLGGEAGLRYGKVHSSASPSMGPVSEEGENTFTNLILRYYF